MRRALALVALLCAVAAWVRAAESAVRPPEFGPPTVVDRPAELPTGTRCLGGRDGPGAFHLIAVDPRASLD